MFVVWLGVNNLILVLMDEEIYLLEFFIKGYNFIRERLYGGQEGVDFLYFPHIF